MKYLPFRGLVVTQECADVNKFGTIIQNSCCMLSSPRKAGLRQNLLATAAELHIFDCIEAGNKNLLERTVHSHSYHSCCLRSSLIHSLEEGLERGGIKFKHQSSKTHTRNHYMHVCSHKSHTVYFAIISLIPHDSSEMYNILLF